jgi:hypothetical protein
MSGLVTVEAFFFHMQLLGSHVISGHEQINAIVGLNWDV